jgi:indole-3-glycerol phosphate synthase
MSLIKDILSESGKRLAERQRKVPLSELQRRAADAPRAIAGFRDALEASDFSIIAEIKAASPSSGAMDPANVRAALEIYGETDSVSAISILTDEDYFGGSLERLWFARQRTTKPILRKDFIVDEYQVWEARAHGADAVLLMADLYRDEPGKLARIFELVRSLGMDALFELGMRTAVNPLSVVPADAMIWGVNSRRFHTTKLQVRSTIGRLLGKELSIDADAHGALRPQIPNGKIAVAESGIQDPADLNRLFKIRYRAALIGTAFLKQGSSVASVVGAFDEKLREMTSNASTRAQAAQAETGGVQPARMWNSRAMGRV